MRVLSFLLRRSPKALATAVTAGVVSGASSALLLAMVHRLVAVQREPPGGRELGFFIGLLVLASGSRVLSDHLLIRLGQGLVRDLRVELSRRILATPLARLEALGSHRLLASLTGDVATISNGLVQIPTLAVGVTVITGSLVYLGMLSPGLLLVLLGVMAVGVVSYQLPLLAGERRFHRAREERDVLFDRFQELTDGIQELKLHRRRAHAFVDTLAASSQRLFKVYVSSLTIFSAAASWGGLLFFAVIGVLAFSARRYLDVAPEELVGYTLILLYIMNPLQGLLNALPDLGQASVALDKVERLRLSLKDEATVGGPQGAPLALSEGPPEGATGKLRRGDLRNDNLSWGTLRFRDVEYLYGHEGGDASGDQRSEESREEAIDAPPDRGFALGPLNLEFEPGETVFITGGNGSGKTTFMRLLVGLYRPSAGTIEVDGSEITGERLEDFQELYSAVFAMPHVFDALLGLGGADLDERASSLLESLEIGHKVAIEGGRLSTVALSQGQRKRLALMVAYLEDRPVYVFDEWAADQDPHFREIFYRRLLPDLAAQGKTLFVISHDDRYYDAADRVLRFDYGQLAYDGPWVGSSFADTTGSESE